MEPVQPLMNPEAADPAEIGTPATILKRCRGPREPPHHRLHLCSSPRHLHLYPPLMLPPENQNAVARHLYHLLRPHIRPQHGSATCLRDDLAQWVP